MADLDELHRKENDIARWMTENIRLRDERDHAVFEANRAIDGMRERDSKIAELCADNDRLRNELLDVSQLLPAWQLIPEIYEEARQLIECLQSIADMDDTEPRQPDDADWRWRALECKRAAECCLSIIHDEQDPAIFQNDRQEST
jgi:hypothetical protein